MGLPPLRPEADSAPLALEVPIIYPDLRLDDKVATHPVSCLFHPFC